MHWNRQCLSVGHGCRKKGDVPPWYSCGPIAFRFENITLPVVPRYTMLLSGTLLDNALIPPPLVPTMW